MSVADRGTAHEVVDEVGHHEVLDAPGIFVLRTRTHAVEPRLHDLLVHGGSIDILADLAFPDRIVDDLRHVIDEVFVARATVLLLPRKLVLVRAVEVDEALREFFRRCRADTTTLINGLPVVLQSLVTVLFGVDHRSTEGCDSSGTKRHKRPTELGSGERRVQCSLTFLARFDGLGGVVRTKRSGSVTYRRSRSAEVKPSFIEPRSGSASICPACSSRFSIFGGEVSFWQGASSRESGLAR